MGLYLPLTLLLLIPAPSSPLRSSVQIVRQDLLSTRPQQTLLAPLKKNKGGRYKHQDKQDSVMFNVYTGVEFGKVEIDTRKGIVAELVLDTPPGSARHEIAATRASYWLGSGKKRLMNGGLVALLWHVEGQVDVHLAAVAIANDKLAQGSRAHQGRLPIKVQFFDSMVNIKIVEHLRQKNRPRDERILVESSVMFDSVCAFSNYKAHSYVSDVNFRSGPSSTHSNAFQRRCRSLVTFLIPVADLFPAWLSVPRLIPRAPGFVSN